MISRPSKLQEFIGQHANDDLKSLALQAKKYPEIDMPFAIQQISGRRVISEKVPSWYLCESLLYPRHLSLEQCSSEATARYKALLVGGNSLIDLTGGFGIDCAFMSEKFGQATYVERNAELCEIARHNFPALSLRHIRVVNGEAIDYLNETEKVDCIFVDPARRNEHGGKTVAVSDCEPDVERLSSQLLEKADRIVIKLSPMLDLSLALQALTQTAEVHIVSVGNECKELILILSKDRVENIPIACVNLARGQTQTFVFTKTEELDSFCQYTSQIESYLYEPNASAMKAGAYKSVANRFGLKKLHANSHLYTSQERCDDFPGRIFAVQSVFSLNRNELKQELGEIKKANLSVRNFPATVAELRKRLKLADGGEFYIFATTLADERRVLVKCLKG